MSKSSAQTDRKSVVVTGANKGVGLATVEAILRADASTFVYLGSRDVARGEAAVASLLQKNGDWATRLRVVCIDVGDDTSIVAAAAAVSRHLDGAPLYGLVNNAGLGFGSNDAPGVLGVNTRGLDRVTRAFEPLLRAPDARLIHIASGSAPNFVAQCSPEMQRELVRSDVTAADVAALSERFVACADQGAAALKAAGFGDGDVYGFSKACVNALTVAHATEFPHLIVNACTPGFIETDLTRGYAEARGMDPAAIGLKPPAESTKAVLRLLLGDPGGSGWYFGSDGERSPMDRYRSPGDPPYTGA